MLRSFLFLIASLASHFNGCRAFVQPGSIYSSTSFVRDDVTHLLAKRPPKTDYSNYDFSSMETRDMTKEEMLDMNKQNEEVMNNEMVMMTGFSLLISLPLIYLFWVAFNSD